MRLSRIWSTLLIVFIITLVAISFIGCGSNTSQGEPSSDKEGQVMTSSCPPEKGLVILGTQGCPHCRALRRYSKEVFGEKGTCFVEVSPAYGAKKEAQTFFVKIYKEAYPGIPEGQMGVPLAFLFYDNSVRGVFIGEVGTKTLVSLENFVSTSTKSVIIWQGQAYQLSATQAKVLTTDIKEFFGNN